MLLISANSLMRFPFLISMMKASTRKAAIPSSIKRDHVAAPSAVEYDQIYLEGVEDDVNQSFGRDVQPSIGGISPIGMAHPRQASSHLISGSSRRNTAPTTLVEDNDTFNDCDSSAMSMALGGLAAANLSLVAREQR